MNKTNSSTGEDTTISPDPSTRRRFFLRTKRKILRHAWLVRVALVLGLIGAIYLGVLFFGFLLGRIGVPSYIHLLYDFTFTPLEQVESQNGRVNILILGKAGAGHNAPDLTDTIIFSSVSLEKPSIVMVSLPRDIWIPAIRAKLNSAYYWGKQKEPGGGLTLAKSLVEEITGQPVHYGIVVDFSGFEGIIDVIGGIEVNVERSFVDTKYPVAGKENDLCGGDKEFKCRYETISFEKGLQKMDGARALKFVRSRNAEGDEGTDLARAARQQKVLLAIKNEVLSPKVYLSPRKLLAIWKEVKLAVETDIGPSAGAILARRALSSKDAIDSYVLSEDFLVNPAPTSRYDDQYVFIPKSGDWEEVHSFISCLVGVNCSEGK
jgi:LCP family protein required for cell wall assembly